MAFLKWINDNALIAAVSQLLKIAENAKFEAEKRFNKNVIDPFSALFQMSGFDLDHENWKKSELTRQSQKTLQNHIGGFHQTILGSVNEWENLKSGNVMDLFSIKYRILAEVKNKFNTVKGSDKAGLYQSMRDAVMRKSSKYRDYTAYYVTIIPKNQERFNKPFVPSDKETGSRFPVNEKIR
jgi:hypothetical protein